MAGPRCVAGTQEIYFQGWGWAGAAQGGDLLTLLASALGLPLRRTCQKPCSSPLFGRAARVWAARGGGLPGHRKTEGHMAHVGCPDQVSYAVLGLGQGDLLLHAEFEILGAEERGWVPLVISWWAGGRKEGGAGISRGLCLGHWM